MNEFGEPNMGNPSVRFDEGRRSAGHWPWASQPSLAAYSTLFFIFWPRIALKPMTRAITILLKPEPFNLKPST